MIKEETPYIARCSFCEEGLLRIHQCQMCNSYIAVCDECELAWADVKEVSRDPASKSSGAYPACPHCSAKAPSWTRMNRAEIELAGLGELIIGLSD